MPVDVATTSVRLPTCMHGRAIYPREQVEMSNQSCYECHDRCLQTHSHGTWREVCRYQGEDGWIEGWALAWETITDTLAEAMGQAFRALGHLVPRCRFCRYVLEGRECRRHGAGCGFCRGCALCEHPQPVTMFAQPARFHVACRLGERRKHRSGRLVGLEIEAVGTREVDFRPVLQAVASWGGQIVADGSLPAYGFEVNTAPAGGDHLVRQIADIADALRESQCRATRSCGLHVHVDCRDVTHADLRRILLVYGLLEPLLFAMQPVWRRTTTWATPCGPSWARGLLTKPARPKPAICTNVFGQANTRGQVNGKGHGTRYRALNVYSYFYRKTLEIRLHAGTVSGAELTRWACFWADLLDTAVRMRERDLVAWLNAAPRPVTVRYGAAFVADQLARHGRYVNRRLMRCSPGMVV